MAHQPAVRSHLRLVVNPYRKHAIAARSQP